MNCFSNKLNILLNCTIFILNLIILSSLCSCVSSQSNTAKQVASIYQQPSKADENSANAVKVSNKNDKVINIKNKTKENEKQFSELPKLFNVKIIGNSWKLERALENLGYPLKEWSLYSPYSKIIYETSNLNNLFGYTELHICNNPRNTVKLILQGYDIQQFYKTALEYFDIENKKDSKKQISIKTYTKMFANKVKVSLLMQSKKPTLIIEDLDMTKQCKEVFELDKKDMNTKPNESSKSYL